LRLRLPTPDEQGAAECFDRALALARRQQAKSFELRAAMSLLHLGRRRGESEGARRALAELHGWFQEGLDTTDLREARALLESPSHV